MKVHILKITDKFDTNVKRLVYTMTLNSELSKHKATNKVIIYFGSSPYEMSLTQSQKFSSF